MTEIVLARDRQAVIKRDVARLEKLRQQDARLQGEIAEIQGDLCGLCQSDERRIRDLVEANRTACGCAA